MQLDRDNQILALQETNRVKLYGYLQQFLQFVTVQCIIVLFLAVFFIFCYFLPREAAMLARSWGS